MSRDKIGRFGSGLFGLEPVSKRLEIPRNHMAKIQN